MDISSFSLAVRSPPRPIQVFVFFLLALSILLCLYRVKRAHKSEWAKERVLKDFILHRVLRSR